MGEKPMSRVALRLLDLLADSAATRSALNKRFGPEALRDLTAELETLEADGLVEKEVLRTGGPGRPTTVYRLRAARPAGRGAMPNPRT